MKILAFGAGTNSSGVIAGKYEREEPIDIYIFADTGGEKPETYQHLDFMQGWLAYRGLGEIIVVKGTEPQQVLDGGLYEECMRLGVLPSRVYGGGSCSMKWKRDPQDKFLRKHPPVVDFIKAGGRPIKIIGYDADEPHRADKDYFENDPTYDYEFPLIDWDWGRDDCIAALDRHGIPRPGKSACFFCPSSRRVEVEDLNRRHPELAQKAIEMERNAHAKLGKIRGLGRHWSWENLLRQQDAFADYTDSVGLQDMPCDCFDGD